MIWGRPDVGRPLVGGEVMICLGGKLREAPCGRSFHDLGEPLEDSRGSQARGELVTIQQLLPHSLDHSSRIAQPPSHLCAPPNNPESPLCPPCLVCAPPSVLPLPCVLPLVFCPRLLTSWGRLGLWQSTVAK